MKNLYYALKIRFLKTLCDIEVWAYSDYANNPKWWNSLIGAAAFILWLNLC
jgi:hypothetical protein